MDALLKTWQLLSLSKKIRLVGAVAATIALMFFLARMATEPSMALLYGGLDQKNAGEVAAALEEMGVETEVRGDSVYVPSTERDRVRLELARQGLPQQGQAGYELLDGLNGFGTTSEMFQATYWRAKEGELARTILSVPGVRSARVHIGAASRRPFSRTSEKSTAAVTVRMAGGSLDERSAVSIRFLVALAVADLEPEQVAVIDAENGVVLKPGEERASAVSDESAERRADLLEQELEDLLSVRVGEGAVRISVSVETSRETSTISERILDPDSKVTMNAQVEELSEKATEPGAPVTVASNLPDGDGANTGAAGQRDRSESRESISYQYSETRRDSVVEAGAIKRLGVAVLVDEVRASAADGSVSYEARSAEELLAIEELIKSAIGFDAERGDTVTVESMRFAPMPELGAEVEISPLERLLTDNLMTIIQVSVLGVVIVVLGLLVVRPILQNGAVSAAAAEFDAEIASTSPVATPAVEGDGQEAQAPAIESDSESMIGLAQERIEKSTVGLLEDSPRFDLEGLQNSVAQDLDASALLLRRWLGSTSAESGAKG